jgi:hypothetical protein
MKTLKAAAATVAVLGATALAGAASAYPVIVAPAPYVYAPPPPPPRVVVAPPPYYYVRPAWVGGVYYGYPYYWRGVRYFGPRGFHGYYRWR